MKDITGVRFGRLVAINPTNERARTCVKWLCKCDCGNEKVISVNALTQGRTKSCGCLLQENLKNLKNKNASINITGNRYGRLVAIKPTNERLGTSVKWLCKCDCGNEKTISVSSLTQGNTKSCGCLTKENCKVLGENSRVDLINKKFGRLTVTEYIQYHRNYKEKTYYKCKCDCGKEFITRADSLTAGSVKSCGCYMKEQSKNTVHEKLGHVDNTCLSILNKMHLPRDNTTGIRGVDIHKQTGKYRARITLQKKQYHLGLFDTLEEAENARKIAKEKLVDPLLEKYGYYIDGQ